MREIRVIREDGGQTSVLVGNSKAPAEEMCAMLFGRWGAQENVFKYLLAEYDLDVPENFERLSHPVELALFRVLQEGLSNVHRHSGSPTASIRLARQGGTVLLEVRDAGRGLDPAALGGSTLGVGIAGMRERLRQHGGRVEIELSLPGTRLRAILPLEK